MASIIISDINVAGASLLTDLTEAELQVTGGCGHHSGYGRGSKGKKGSKKGSRKGSGKGSRKGSKGKKRGNYGCYC
ncbi:MAG: hypothetical protein RLZZ511_3306 [Cyanobacteriota bacterium]|jgi:hypothetical protein